MMVQNCEFTESVPERFTTEENCVQGLSFVGYLSNFWFCEPLMSDAFSGSFVVKFVNVASKYQSLNKDASVKNFVNVASQKFRYPAKTKTP